jgi:hypothetical protein
VIIFAMNYLINSLFALTYFLLPAKWLVGSTINHNIVVERHFVFTNYSKPADNR